MKRHSPLLNRAQALARVEQHLRRHGFPRLQMLFLVTLTGGFGLLASFCMLRLGMDAMALRYPLALACAYLFFLFLIWLWLRTSAQDHQDIPDLSGLVPSDLPGAPQADFASGGGGDFGGGGASASFDASPVACSAPGEAPDMLRTLLPFALTAVFLSVTGLAMSWYAPGANSIGRVMAHASVSK